MPLKWGASAKHKQKVCKKSAGFKWHQQNISKTSAKYQQKVSIHE
jgi:hypothetical protein